MTCPHTRERSPISVKCAWAGGPLTVLFVAVSAVTAGAVLRVAARVFLGLGPRPRDDSPYQPPHP